MTVHSPLLKDVPVGKGRYSYQTHASLVGLVYRDGEAMTSTVSRFGLAVRRKAGKRKDLGSIPLRLSFLFTKVVVCGHCLVTLSITSY